MKNICEIEPADEKNCFGEIHLLWRCPWGAPRSAPAVPCRAPRGCTEITKVRSVRRGSAPWRTLRGERSCGPRTRLRRGGLAAVATPGAGNGWGRHGWRQGWQGLRWREQVSRPLPPGNCVEGAKQTPCLFQLFSAIPAFGQKNCKNNLSLEQNICAQSKNLAWGQILDVRANFLHII